MANNAEFAEKFTASCVCEYYLIQMHNTVQIDCLHVTMFKKTVLYRKVFMTIQDQKADHQEYNEIQCDEKYFH